MEIKKLNESNQGILIDKAPWLPRKHPRPPILSSPDTIPIKQSPTRDSRTKKANTYPRPIHKESSKITLQNRIHRRIYRTWRGERRRRRRGAREERRRAWAASSGLESRATTSSLVDPRFGAWPSPLETLPMRFEEDEDEDEDRRTSASRFTVDTLENVWISLLLWNFWAN